MRDVLPIAVSLLRPDFLWLALLLPLLWWRIGRPLTIAQRLLRTALFGCILLALAQPSLVLRRPGARQTILLDTRTGDAGAAALRRALAQAGRADRVTLIALGDARPAIEDSRIDARVTLPAGALSTGLERALAEMPPGATGAVTVIGDGTGRDAHWGDAVAGLIGRGIPVHAIAVPAPAGPPAITDIAFAPVRVGEMAQATLTIAGRGDGVAVALFADDQPVARSNTFAVDGTTQLTLRFPAGHAGFVPVRAVLTPGPQVLQAVAAVQDPLRLLYVEGRQQGAAPRLQALLGPGFAVDARSPAALTPAFDLTAYPLLFVDDVPARALAAPVQQRLLDAVTQRGAGLFYAGGAQAFGMGGYDGTPLAAALPVTLRQEDKLEQPSVALVVVIDSSGSMTGTPIELAKQVARFAVRKLGPTDSVGVVEFYGAKQWAVPLQPARDIPGVERAIGRMQAQGSSILFPAIQEAYYALKGSNARYKHILVISDAGVEEQRYQALLTHIADDRINLSTALVGADPEGEERMAQWARWGRGRYYAVPDEFSLVELNLKQPQDKPAPGYRSGSFAVQPLPGSPRWHGMTLAGAPPLSGYVPAGRRAAAETLLTTPAGDPLLASWQRGAGRVTALMTEPLGEGTAPWRGWPGYGAWLASLIARTADQHPAATLQLDRRFDMLTATFRDPAGDGTAPVLRFLDAQGRPGAAVTMIERAPGLFTARTRIDPAQPARAELRRGALVLRAADRAGSDIGGGHVLPLDALARRTGGTYANGPDAPFAPPRPPAGGLVAVALGGWLALLALLLYLVELLHRRWPGRRRPA